MSNFIKVVFLLGFGLSMLGLTASQPVSIDCDVDGDGLIEISTLDQLDAIRYDADGDGDADDPDHAEAFYSAFPGTTSGMGCPNPGCVGYELARDLDFKDPDSYASGEVNTRWTQGAGWIPIGFDHSSDDAGVSRQSVGWSGTLDGSGHTIANLRVYRSGADGWDHVGLFASVEDTGAIRDLGLIEAVVAGDKYVGALAGDNDGIIESSYANAWVQGEDEVGGLVGRNRRGSVEHSYADSVVYGEDAVGGLVGSNHEGAIVDSHSSSTVTGHVSVGGLAGENGGVILLSHATGNVFGIGDVSERHGEAVGGLVGSNGGHLLFGGLIGASFATGNVSGIWAVGGLIGENEGYPIVSNHAAGHVLGHSNVGGLIGYDSSGLYAGHATGDVSGDSSVGGLIGETDDGVIVAGYATGRVSGWLQVGGLVGKRSREASIITSYSIGTVSGEEAVGGLVGFSEPEIEDRFYNSIPVKSIKASYWNVETSGQVAGVGEGPTSGAVGKTTAELQTPTGNTGIYDVWNTDLDNGDFDADTTTGREDFWIFGDSTQYPVLKSLRNGDSSTGELWSFISLLLEHHADAPARTDLPTSTNTTRLDHMLGPMAQRVQAAGTTAQLSSQEAFVPRLTGAERKSLPDLTPLAAAANAALLLAPLGIIRFMRGRRMR